MPELAAGEYNVPNRPETPRNTFLLAGLVALIFCAPFIVSTYIPLVDLPHHIARHQILADIANGGPLAKYFVSDGPKMGNSTVDMIAASGWVSDVLWLSRVSLIFYTVSFVASIMVFHRVLWKRWSITPLVASPIIYNDSFYWGFQNFILAIPLVIFLLALWIACQKRPVLVTTLLFFPLVFGLYALHSFAFFAFCAAVFGFELPRLFRSPYSFKRLGRPLILSAPFWFPLFHFLSSQVLVDTGRPAANAFGGIGSRLEAANSVTHTKIRMPEMAILDLGNISSILSLILVYCFLLLILLSFANRISVVTHQDAKGPILALFIAALAMPAVVSGVVLTHIRIPAIACAIALSAMKFPHLGVRGYRIIAAILISVSVVRATDLTLSGTTLGREMAELRSLLVELPPEARLSVKWSPKYWPEYQWHLSSYPTVWISETTPTLFPSAHGVSAKPQADDNGNCQISDANLSFFGNGILEFTHVLIADPQLYAIAAKRSDLRKSASENYMVVDLCEVSK